MKENYSADLNKKQPLREPSLVGSNLFNQKLAADKLKKISVERNIEQHTAYTLAFASNFAALCSARLRLKKALS